jgi:hypothetical protein
MSEEEEERLVKELVQKIPDDIRASMEEAAAADGLTLEEYVLLLLRDMEQQGLFDAAADPTVSEDEFLRLVFVGDCPGCGSQDTDSCDEEEEIDDATLGICRECGLIWCLECGSTVTRGEQCGHWEVCEACDEDKDEYGDCGVLPEECPRVIEWIAENYALACQSTCAWCLEEIPEAGEVYAVGATLRGGIEFASNESGTGFFMPVAIGDKLVPAIVTSADSEARQQGNDLMFMTCSEVCACSLRDALCEQKEFIDRAELN